MKLLKTFVIILGLTAFSNVSFSMPMLYTFEGVVTGFRSFHSDYSLNDFDIRIGQTPLRYVFLVDLEADNSSSTNAAGTWNYFFSDLVEGSIVNGGRSYGDYRGFNWDRVSGPNLGQISSNLADVRITASAATTTDWNVSDWSLGQRFESTDLACYLGGTGSGCAVYADGDVALVSIESAVVSAPASFSLVLVGLLLGAARRQRIGQRIGDRPRLIRPS